MQISSIAPDFERERVSCAETKSADADEGGDAKGDDEEDFTFVLPKNDKSAADAEFQKNLNREVSFSKQTFCHLCCACCFCACAMQTVCSLSAFFSLSRGVKIVFSFYTLPVRCFACRCG